ncbi:RpiB/LacA/LacB family sugar-phosphate isomerase [Candidatus Saccharibacteria bacterium]|nr:RpiB/LacA/LacB family sugar-phosphate isomerase [Candidatus Saccharibacteria bacterium]
MKKIILGYDHKAIDLGQEIEKILQDSGHEVINIGAKDAETRLPLQDLIPDFVQKFNENKADFGIISCGTGVGVEIGANKFKGIRASLCHTVEQAQLARQYDDANVLCLASWDELDVEKILSTWVETAYDGNEARKNMLDIFDSWGA